MENNRSLWKKVLKIAGIVVLVFLLVFGGLVAYAYYTYKKDNSRTGVWYYANELPLTSDQYVADFDEIHRIVLDNYSLYRQKGLDMDSLYRVFASRISIYGCCYTQGYQRFVVHKQAQRVPACCWLLR